MAAIKMGIEQYPEEISRGLAVGPFSWEDKGLSRTGRAGLIEAGYCGSS